MLDMDIEVDLNLGFNYATGSEIEDIRRCLSTLYSTPVGSVGLYRNFGIDTSILDNPTETAKQLFAVEVIKKTEQFEKRVEVVEVTYEQNTDGLLKPKVVINYVGTR